MIPFVKGEIATADKLNQNFGGKPECVASIAALRQLRVPQGSDAQTLMVDGYASADDGGGGQFIWSATATNADDGGTIIAPNTNPTQGRWLRLFTGPVNVRWFGAKGGGVTDDQPACQAAANSGALSGFIPRGSYAFGSTLTLPKGFRLTGESKHNTYIIQKVAGTPATLIQTSSGNGGGQIIEGLQFQVQNAGNICVDLVGVDKALVQNNRFQFPNSGVGIGIQIDRNGIGGAYSHQVISNEIQNAAIGVNILGTVTNCIIARNWIIATIGVKTDQNGDASQAGANNYVHNLLQAIISGSGTGLDLGTGGGCTGDFIAGNYFEGQQYGIMLRASTVKESILPNHWDGVATPIENLAGADAYNELDFESGAFSLREFQFAYAGKGAGTAGWRNLITGNYAIWLDGSDNLNIGKEATPPVTVNVVADATAISPTARCLSLNGNSAARANCVLDVSGVVDGQRLTLLGVTWAVGLAATNVNFTGGTLPTFGNAAGQVAVMELIYSSGEGKWIEISRHTR